MKTVGERVYECFFFGKLAFSMLKTESRGRQKSSSSEVYPGEELPNELRSCAKLSRRSQNIFVSTLITRQRKP